jgi:hypothetical protein
MNEKIFVLVSEKRATNHILHLLLCVPTFGIWLVVWFIVANNNATHNDKIQRKIDKLLNPEASGMNDDEMYQRLTPEESAASRRRALLVAGGIIFLPFIIAILLDVVFH